ncbi:hypothetical protein KXD96_28210 (plasmid) [Mycobacterium sp. SMC-2]|uniref:hypothetical protein n=1 Tax=Mycobacterium sp. SMC-2 TaxID=2857058 RepID=UPI0021B2ECA7|nr:hypothetical protein [Mycobacterium sp. SMC-2]UXA06552.1 hypothetical protein KXD96_27685 [Mycobacterium sp. SMC-2]UXA09644.1 hypothetical protein KXD96_28210 [Mycobacterium sp. SMC-2]
MSAPILTGPKRILRKWRQRRAGDDQALFDADMHRFIDMCDRIYAQRVVTGHAVEAFPSILSTTLDIALFLVRRDFPDQVAGELAAWRADIAAAAA